MKKGIIIGAGRNHHGRNIETVRAIIAAIQAGKNVVLVTSSEDSIVWHQIAEYVEKHGTGNGYITKIFDQSEAHKNLNEAARKLAEAGSVNAEEACKALQTLANTGSMNSAQAKAAAQRLKNQQNKES
jgi:hypothetical protein